MAVRKFLCPFCRNANILQEIPRDGRVVCTYCGRQVRVQEKAKNSEKTDKTKSPEVNDTETVDSPPKKKVPSPNSVPPRDLSLQEKKNGKGQIWQPGQYLLGGKYRIVEIAPGIPYAEGGVGVVHRVHHEEWDTDFAMKSPKPEFMVSESGKISFERECQLWIELGLHTNVVSCYLIRRIDGIPRVFAEFVQDGNLREWIADGRLYEGGDIESLARILDVAIQFARGLGYAHRRGLLHLDVKPGNVMMSGGVAKVTDFGLSKVVQEGMENNGLPDDCDGLTPSYCSPEQYEAFTLFQERKKTPKDARSLEEKKEEIRITRQSDIWSWAVSVLAMFYGRAPCKKGGQTAAEVFEAVLKKGPSPGHPAIPPGMVSLFRRCFQKDPEKRPESMDWISDELVRVYEEELGRSYPRPKPTDTPFTPESACNRAVSLYDLGKLSEALTQIKGAAEQVSWHPQITYDKALMFWRGGKITDLEALHSVTELAKHYGTDAQSYYALGLIQRERGNLRGAVPEFERAVELDASHPEYHKALISGRKHLKKESASVGRILLEVSPGQSHPLCYLTENQNFCFVSVPTGRFSLINSLSGQEVIRFRRVDRPTGDVVALSDDYTWSVQRQGERLILIRPDAKPGAKDFSTVLRKNEPLLPVAWGVKDSILDQTGRIRLRINGHIVDYFNEKTKVHLHLKGHSLPVTSLSLTPDGKWGVTGAMDKTLRLWQLETGRCLRTFSGLSGPVEAVWIDAHARFILTVTHETNLQFWNIDYLCNGQSLSRAPVMICMVSSSEEAALRQMALDHEIEQFHDAVEHKDWAEAVASVHRAQKLDGWQSIRSELKLPETLGRHTEIVGISDSVSAFSVQSSDEYGHEEKVSSVALATDGLTGISAGKDQVLLHWNFRQKEPLARLTGHQDWIRSVDIARDGRFAVTGSWDRSVRVWSLTSHQLIRTLNGSFNEVESVRLAPDGCTIAVGTGNGAISFWNGMSGERIGGFSIEGPVCGMNFSADGRYLLVGTEGAMVLVHAGTFETAARLESFRGSVFGVDLSADLHWALGADQNGGILLYDLTKLGSGPIMNFSGHTDEISSALFMPDCRFFVTASKDRTVRYWRRGVERPIKILEGYAGKVTALATDFLASALFTGSEDAQVRLWNIFWDYSDTPSSSISQDDLVRILQVVTGRYLRFLDMINNKRNPSAYYQRVHELQPDISLLSSDSKILQKIVNEVTLRGYGILPRGEIVETLRSVLRNWSGLLIVGE